MLKAVAVILGGVLLACGGGYVSTYVAEHPEWDRASFPRVSSGLAEVVAGVLDRRTDVQNPRIFIVTANPWKVIPVRDFISGEYQLADDQSYLVTGFVACNESELTLRHYNMGYVWYLLPGNQLAAYRHSWLGEVCHMYEKSFIPDGFDPTYAECLHRFAAAAPYGSPDEIRYECEPSAFNMRVSPGYAWGGSQSLTIPTSCSSRRFFDRSTSRCS